MSTEGCRRKPFEEAVAAARPVSFWLDDTRAPSPAPSLHESITADLTVVGAGFSGLWTALLAKDRDPGTTVVVLEGERVGWAATGRNGGFCAASLTHGDENGRSHFGDEVTRLRAMGRENLDAIESFVSEHHVDCGWERTGELAVATEPWQLEEMRGRGGPPPGWLEPEELLAEVTSPTYLGGIWNRDGCAIVNPARLAWGIRDACLEAGVLFFEHTEVKGVEHTRGPSLGGRSLRLHCKEGSVDTERVALATNAFTSLVPQMGSRIVPVYDHVLVTEPLTDSQLGTIGWRHRQGVGDAGNQFHYYRLTQDNRILWGGYDAIYHYGRKVKPAYDQRAATFTKLAHHFAQTFPSLRDVSFTHRWGGAIDTCSRFCAFFGTSFGGRLAYAAGYTGLGVGATRFGAQVMLDLLSGEPTERTELSMVRRKPMPFPPEPLAWVVIQATRASLAWADTHTGRRNAWLRLLDRFGLGFDS